MVHDEWEMYGLNKDPLEKTNLAHKDDERSPSQEAGYKRLERVEQTRLKPVS